MGSLSCRCLSCANVQRRAAKFLTALVSSSLLRCLSCSRKATPGSKPWKPRKVLKSLYLHNGPSNLLSGCLTGLQVLCTQRHSSLGRCRKLECENEAHQDGAMQQGHTLPDGLHGTCLTIPILWCILELDQLRARFLAIGLHAR